MNVEYKKIKSSSSPEDSLPWYDLSVNSGEVIVETDGDGGHDPDLSGDTIVIDDSQDSVVAVEQGSKLITYPSGSKDVPNLRAHLGWYDSDSDTLTILNFVED